MRIALLQMCSGIDPVANRETLIAAIAEAKMGGATMLFTPEMCGLLDSKRHRARAHICREEEDETLRALCNAARKHELWLHIGSLAVRIGDGDDQLANRSFVIDDSGAIRARYDKMHLFDVDLPNGETWRESAAYRPGLSAIIVDTPVGPLGLSICYDIRFPALFSALSDAGAKLLAVPAAFTVPTGKAHWHILLRARAIENAAFVIAAAQCGRHEDGRETYGHSVVIDPWGTLLLDREGVGLGYADIDLERVADVRARIPVLAHRRIIPQVEHLP
jgi:deaminated glutathione amidase